MNVQSIGREIPIEVAENVRDAVDGADIICTVTASSEPVLRGEWIDPGAHVNAVGASARTAREIDSQAIVNASLFVDRRESALAEAGEFLIAKDEGLIDQDHIKGELGEILVGAVPGRTSDGEITLFKSLGLAIEDAASAENIYNKALVRGKGAMFELGESRCSAHTL